MKNKKIKTENLKFKTTKSSPLVSVVLPVFNTSLFLRDCLDSIFNQTYKNYEVIAVDDASTDNSYKILQEYSQKYANLKIYRNRQNRGVSETAKKAIKIAKGQYLARMDADDIMPSYRLERQVEHLIDNKETVAVGGQALVINENNRVIGQKDFPLTHEEIYKYIFKFIPLQQPSMTIARNRLPADFEYYKNGMNTAEEVELYFKLFNYGKVENMDKILLLYRHHENNTSLKNVKMTFLLTLLARIKGVLKYNYQPTLGGIITTFTQAIFILALPQQITLPIYKTLREKTLKNYFVRNYTYLGIKI